MKSLYLGYYHIAYIDTRILSVKDREYLINNGYKII